MANISVYLNTLRQKGYLAYEYNPFHNYLTEVDLYLVNKQFLVPKGQAVNTKNGELLTKKGNEWADKRGRIIKENVAEAGKELELYAKAGSLIDLETDLLNFDLDHPVDITVLPSYDGSVNLIINDDKNIPRLINSRFSVREKNTYEIVDRIGENDTNIYNSKTFDKDTSLYFLYEDNPHINYLGYVKGILPVGNYCFYFTYCDSDDNESDYIAETGLIPVFIGSDSDPWSMDGGIKNLITNKGIRLKLENLDKSYNYLKVYYIRYFADYLLNRVSECKKIYQRYPINSNTVYLQITGNEEAEDIDANILNITRFNPKSILTQAQCKNMLFFGNIVKNSDNYRELLDCALRIIPEISLKNMELVDNDYNPSNDYGYYSSTNIYNSVGYFDLEYYRFGVVFIYLNGTLSNVYNTLGCLIEEGKTIKYKDKSLFDTPENQSYLLKRKYVSIDDFGWIKNPTDFIDNDDVSFVNGRGVCKLNGNIKNNNQILGIKFSIPQEVVNYLKEDLGIRGLFFVRQKCVPNILAQCYLMPFDELLEAPVLEYNEKQYTECFVKQDLESDKVVLTNTYLDRLYDYKHNESADSENSISKKAYAAICPDFLLNLPYYNLIFNGSKFRILKITNNGKLSLDGRYYKENEKGIEYTSSSDLKLVIICSVTEDVPSIAIKDKVFKLEMGAAEEVYRFKYAEIDKGIYDVGNDNKYGVNKDFDSINKATNLVRGIYSPYLAIYSEQNLDTSALYNIYLDISTSILQEYLNRMDSSEPFYAISDRYNFETLTKVDNSRIITCWRGDCYINTFTYRLNRNFNDPSLPNNDVIIDKDTWQNYDIQNSEKWADISRSDINAVQLGSWITFKVRSAMNYALRSQDHSYVAEEALMGSPRSYYPRTLKMWKGANKLPDSYLYNDAYRATLGFKCYFTLQDINYIKDTFSNRILYSAISVLDSFKNNYRYSLSTYFRDYSQEYGSIIRLVGFEGYILVVFEHAIGIAVINERILAGGSDGEPVFINTQNVLPEELTIITDTYGTQWGESVIKSEVGFVYGVDTVAKKIWRVKGQEIEILSDFKVGKFLIDNISLGERELYPIVGLKNVKTHYNNNKKDIMFTFYDDIYEDEEKVWNLCYNEILGEFVTFYSWVPSYSENIDTLFFTFNRDTAKGLSLLGKCNYSIPENTGVLVDSPILDDSGTNFKQLTIEILERKYYAYKNTYNYDKIVYLKTETIPEDFDTLKLYSSFEEELDKNKENLNEDNFKDALKLAYSDEYDKITIGPANLYYFASDLVRIKIFNTDNSNLELETRYEFKNVGFELEKDHWGNYLYFNIEKNDKKEYYELAVKEGEQENAYKAFLELKVLYLIVKPVIEEEDLNNIISDTVKNTYFKAETIAVTLKSIIDNPALTHEEKYSANLTTDFYLHGQAGIFDIKENVYPCNWYGLYHPFEFEFIVNDNIGQLKIFTDLVMISNKAEPESFHFEIEGDNYEFSSDKRTMYFRLEATKNLYLNLGSNILYNRDYTDIMASEYTLELYYRGSGLEKSLNDPLEISNKYEYKVPLDKVYPVENSGLILLVKSTIFPLYYEKIDTYNEIYHSYYNMRGNNYDFKNLSGSEIAWNRDLNQFNIITHIKNSPIDHYGRLRGNSRYKEGKWNILIPSITFMLKNEKPWSTAESADSNLDYYGKKYKVPPIVINSLYVPADIINTSINAETLPNIFTRTGTNIKNIELRNYISTSEWTYRKEAKIRDKWMKVRIRYSGKNLAIIHSLITLYNISYS